MDYFELRMEKAVRKNCTIFTKKSEQLTDKERDPWRALIAYGWKGRGIKKI